MKILFFGKFAYSIPYLQALTDYEWLVYVVITRKVDEQAYFGKTLFKSILRSIASIIQSESSERRDNQPIHSIVRLAKSAEFAVLWTEDVNSPKFVEHCRKIRPDFIIVAGFDQILKTDIINVPARGCINFHPSLLPRYRGPVPCFWAIAKGEKVTGVTSHYVTTGIDDGPIIAQQKIPILDSYTGGILEHQAARVGSKLMCDLLSQPADHKLEAIEQSTLQAEYYRRPSKKDLRIDWNKSSKDIFNLVRAARPSYKPYVIFADKEVHVTDCRISKRQSKGRIGEVVSANSDAIEVTCKDGIVTLTQIEVENIPSSIRKFVKQYSIRTGTHLS